MLKWLLTSSSHLGRALAELFGLLVLQSVGTQTSRLRRHPNNINQNARPCVPAQRTASMLTKLLVDGLNWKCPDEIPISRLRCLTLYLSVFEHFMELVLKWLRFLIVLFDFFFLKALLFVLIFLCNMRLFFQNIGE